MIPIAADFPTWREWLTRAGANQTTDDRGLKINSTAAVINAAVAARGVALVRNALVAQEIDSGRLVHLMPDARWPVKWAYYIVTSSKALRRYEVTAFHDWIVSYNEHRLAAE
ncbi:hypothetical protein GCM10010520_13380 [Rhizobium viscosum]|uniref:DNA-binding transcriptional LysR family regulator n=1 Tax=Rhizobium viscosum TaxID=1673 RepID=A0ABR9IY38_RHIVS|nr:LysR substrate-binding domain-containing protein [Rhizobium viscosum]MBE1508115.1 DNA-binding transcriptional LysR family regulator [Rhizobium viscosum]